MPEKKMPDGTVVQGVAILNQGGQYGVRNTTGTGAVSGTFTSIQMLADTVFAVLTETGAAGDSLVGVTIPAGVTLFGQFTAYTLTSGKVRAYA